jgi:hypothetical protein
MRRSLAATFSSSPERRLRSWCSQPSRPRFFLLLFATLLGTLGCNSASRQPPFSPAPSGIVSAVTDMGPIQTNSRILGRDGGYSALFSGYSVWVYGDTFLASPNAQGDGLISDSWSFTSNLTAQNGITGFQERLDSAGAPTMILAYTAEEQAFNSAHSGNPCQQQPCGARWALWPSAIVADTANNRALIFYMLISALPGTFNFQAVGYSVAAWQNFQDQPQRPVLNPPIVTDHPDLLFTQDEPSFGSAALIVNGRLYAYGCGTPPNGSGKPCRLGRVDPANVLDRNSWTFYAANGNWSPQISDAVSVFGGDDFLSVSWNPYLQLYVAVYNAPVSSDVMMRTSVNPEGPWSGETKIFTAMQPTAGVSWVYDTLTHPEFNGENGRTMYLSYSRGTGTFSSEVRLVSLEFSSAANP